MISLMINGNKFSFVGIKKNKPPFATINRRLKVVSDIGCQLIIIKSGINDCPIGLDTELTSDVDEKVINENENQAVLRMET